MGNSMRKTFAILMLAICLFGCVQTYSRSFTGSFIGLSPSELSSQLEGIAKERGFSLLGTRKNHGGYSSIDEYERKDAVSQKRLAIGIYLKESSKKEDETEILFTVGALGWEEETKKLVDKDFESLVSKVEAHFGEKLTITKKSESW
jgi:hypothetical protein